MERYHKFLSFFAYVFGFIALIAVLVDDKKNKLYSFHIWQAFLLNTFIATSYVVYIVLYLPQKIPTTEGASRTPLFFLLILTLVLLILAIIAYNEKYFKIPLIGDLSSKISKYKEK